MEMKTIIKTKSAESKSLPLAITCIATTSMCVIFGFSIGDSIVIVPNLLKSFAQFDSIASLYFIQA
jgi:hypothetical protein